MHVVCKHLLCTLPTVPMFDVTDPVIHGPQVAQVKHPDGDPSEDYDPYAKTRVNPESELISDLFGYAMSIVQGVCVRVCVCVSVCVCCIAVIDM